ncbi:hypothetical protein ACA910_004932 [Epithemia clementina (nom. ined.)]
MMRCLGWTLLLWCGCNAFCFSRECVTARVSNFRQNVVYSHKTALPSSSSSSSSSSTQPAWTNHLDVSSSRLSLSANSASSSDTPPDGSLDVDALLKYGAALGIQLALFYGLFSVMDQVVASAEIDVPFGANVVFFWVMSLRSRVLNPLSNKRPDPKTFEAEGVEKTRNLPTWIPPGFVFPIMWILIIGPLRAVSTAMIYDVTHSYATPAILALAAHLSIGDIWNTINNVEKRYGTAVPGVAGVWLSKAFTAYQYAQISPMAGQLMTLPLLWLTVAFTLVVRIWQLNPDEQTGKVEPLYPVVGKSFTEFAWFAKSEQ